MSDKAPKAILDACYISCMDSLGLTLITVLSMCKHDHQYIKMPSWLPQCSVPPDELLKYQLG